MVLLACVSTTDRTYSVTSHDRRNTILLEEITNSHATDAYDLIRNLRPLWLRGRGRKSIFNEGVSYPTVYVDGGRHGGIESLATTPVEDIAQIQFLDSGDATLRFGVNHPSGAILITLK